MDDRLRAAYLFTFTANDARTPSRGASAERRCYLLKQRKEQFLLCPLKFRLPVFEAVVRRRMLMILLNPRRNPFIPM